MATVETYIPLTKIWDAEEIERYDNVTLIDVDKYINKFGNKAAKFGRRVIALALNRSLSKPDENVIFEVSSALNEHIINTTEHGESPRIARVISLNEVVFLDTANKKADKDSEFCAGLGDQLIKARFGKDCIERIEEDGMCYTRVPIDLAHPISHEIIEPPDWPEFK